MSWLIDSIRLTNRAQRVLRGPSTPRQINALVGAYCNHYWSLLLDPGFRRDIEAADGISISASPLSKDELRCHFNEAIAVLAEAGVDGTVAVEALRDLEQVMATKFPNGLIRVDCKDFFAKLGSAKKAICAAKHELALAQTPGLGVRLQRNTWATAGLVVVGLSAAGLTLLTAPVAGAAAAGAAAAAAGSAVLGAIGSTLFQHNTSGL